MSSEGNAANLERRPVIVWAPGEYPVSWRLPPAIVYPGTWISGGIRTLHELATAIAATGRTVELRGHVLPQAVDELSAAAGARVELPTESRRPRPGEIVIVPEGIQDPLQLGRLVLSGARVVLAVLAPTGLFGWPLVGNPEPTSPLKVDPEALARPEHFQAIAALELTCWTHMQRIHELAAAAGVSCRLIGNGNPLPPRPPAEKRVDVVWLRANRWAPLAERIVDQIDATVEAVDEVDHSELLRRLDAAKILLWPSRIEGHARVATEARAVGSVPVALDSNVFATGLTEQHGAVTVERIDDLPAAIHELLANPARLAALSERGRRAAREQLDWTAFVRRVDDALGELDAAEDRGVDARSAMGARADELQQAALAETAQLRSTLEATRSELASTVADRDGLQSQRDLFARDLLALRERRAVRAALQIAGLRVWVSGKVRGLVESATSPVTDESS